MSKQNDILKESKREFEKLIQDKDAWIDHETLDTGKAWNFIETQIKKAVQARERDEERCRKPEFEKGDLSTYGQTNLAKAIVYLADVLKQLSQQKDEI